MSKGMPHCLPSYMAMPSTSGLEKSSQSKLGIARFLVLVVIGARIGDVVGEGRHPGLVEIVDVVGAELALDVLGRLGEHLLERHDLDLDLDAGRLGELAVDHWLATIVGGVASDV